MFKWITLIVGIVGFHEAVAGGFEMWSFHGSAYLGALLIALLAMPWVTRFFE